MTKLMWNNPGERFFEAGVDRGALFVHGGVGVAWNGLISVTESPSGGEPTPYYIDGVKYLNISAPEDFGASIEAYTYPDEFAACDGTIFENGLGFGGQQRQKFNLTYRTKIGNDLAGVDHGYKVHFIYNALAFPSEKAYVTQGDSIEATTFSWELSTTPEKITGKRPTAHLVVDSTKTTSGHIRELDNILYGSDETPSRFPTPEELINIFGSEMFVIMPNETSGLAVLVPEEENPDLFGVRTAGVYGKTTTTSLVETSVPGIYVQEE